MMTKATKQEAVILVIEKETKSKKSKRKKQKKEVKKQKIQDKCVILVEERVPEIARFPRIPGSYNNLWKWDTLEDVKM